jgi:transcriptional regulator with XRE-family HTH domain
VGAGHEYAILLIKIYSQNKTRIEEGLNMAEEKTRLERIMKLFDVAGKELAFAVGTDTTTISKIKKGERKLKYNSKYAKSIAEYFLREEFTIFEEKLSAVLEPYGFSMKDEPKEKKIDILALWLCDENGENILPETEYKSRFGYEGWKNGILEFFDTALKSENDFPVILCDIGDIDWEKVEHEFIHFMINKIETAVKSGRKVVIIDKITADYKTYKTLFRWLPLYLNENVEVRYIHEQKARFYDISIYAVEKTAVLIGIGIKDNTFNNFTEIYGAGDKEKIDFYFNLARRIKDDSHKLINVSSLADPLKMIEIMEKYIRSEPITYMINSMPSYLNMPTELLEEILESNEADCECRRICIDANIRRREVRKRCNYRQFYDLDALEAALRQPYIVEAELSVIAGKEMRLSNSQFRRQLEFIMQTANSNSKTYQLALPSFQNIHLNIRESSIVVQDDSIVIAWNTKLCKNRIHCVDLTVVGGFFNYMTEVWNNIPPIKKDENWTKKQFERLLCQ